MPLAASQPCNCPPGRFGSHRRLCSAQGARLRWAVCVCTAGQAASSSDDNRQHVSTAGATPHNGHVWNKQACTAPSSVAELLTALPQAGCPHLLCPHAIRAASDGGVCLRDAVAAAIERRQRHAATTRVALGACKRRDGAVPSNCDRIEAGLQDCSAQEEIRRVWQEEGLAVSVEVVLARRNARPTTT